MVDARALTTSFLAIPYRNERQLSVSLSDAIDLLEKVVTAEDFDVAVMLVGEVLGLIHDRCDRARHGPRGDRNFAQQESK